jgi:hypothetical protein
MRNFVRNIDLNIVLNCFSTDHLSVLTSRPPAYQQATRLQVSVDGSKGQLQLGNRWKRTDKLSCILLLYCCSQRLFDQFRLSLLTKTTNVHPSLS